MTISAAGLDERLNSTALKNQAYIKNLRPLLNNGNTRQCYRRVFLDQISPRSAKDMTVVSVTIK